MKLQRRETTQKDSAIVAPMADADVLVRVPWEALYADDWRGASNAKGTGAP